jgi:hypothetical protein
MNEDIDRIVDTFQTLSPAGAKQLDALYVADARFKKGQAQCILGSSHLVLDDDTGRITLHRDYWDAAKELYEKLTLRGGLMHWLKRRANP